MGAFTRSKYKDETCLMEYWKTKEKNEKKKEG
jgi:hypothetical protein